MGSRTHSSCCTAGRSRYRRDGAIDSMHNITVEAASSCRSSLAPFTFKYQRISHPNSECGVLL
jgi:hypothetical protein